VNNLKKYKKFWANKKVFITGHTGFKGTWLGIILNILKANIHGYALKPEKNSLFIKSKILKSFKTNTFANINDFELLKKKLITIKPTILIHLAAQPLVIESYKNPKKTFETNIIGTLNVLEAAREVKTLKSIIIVTTDKVYKIKKKNKIYVENDELWGTDPYSASKVGAEIVTHSYLNSFFKKKKLKSKIATVRAGNVLGGGDFSENRIIPDIYKAIKNKNNLVIRNPNYIRPWQHVIDPLMGYLKLAQIQYYYKKKLNNNWNFGPDKKSFKKVIDVVNFIKKKINLNLR
jgi:CDP-glucose 4,6-dehydratase